MGEQVRKVLLLICAVVLMAGCTQKKEAKWLFVLHSLDAEMSATELKMTDPDRYVLAFTDRPERKTAMIPIADFVKNWPESFDKKNTKASIAYFDEQHKYYDAALELADPEIKENSLVFKIKALDKAEPGKLGEAALFIDPTDQMCCIYNISK
ncbi:MAG: hypothetical protein H7A36_00985 [Chlamydiales bacterium]|nr:hypothetical protein [Chlamydiales bacterium]